MVYTKQYVQVLIFVTYESYVEKKVFISVIS